MGARTFQASKLEPWQREDAQRLRQLVRSSKLGQAEIAARCGWTQPMVAQYVTGRRPLNVDAAAQLASALGVRVDKFSPRLYEELEALSRKGGAGAPSPGRSTRLFRHWVSERGADLAAEWEQLQEPYKTAIETLVMLTVAAQARGELPPSLDVGSIVPRRDSPVDRSAAPVAQPRATPTKTT